VSNNTLDGPLGAQFCVYVQCAYTIRSRAMTAEQRDRRWAFRVKSRSDAIVREAATLAGQSLTAFVEESAVVRAESVIASATR
jgi:hypothetical protein